MWASKSAKSSIGLIGLIRLYPVASYFTLTFAISWMGALASVAPMLIEGKAIPKLSGLLMFPIMLLGPSIAGVSITWIAGDKRGLHFLWSRMTKFKIPIGWYLALLIPPIGVLGVLEFFKFLISVDFAPNLFLRGLFFGVIAGFVEEVGWTGFAFGAMASKRSALMTSVGLGVLWAIWHIPVVDYLGTATPHGHFWIPYFLTFATAMMAIRTLICWLYQNTGSVLLAQLMHASSTGALVVFSPSMLTGGQEALWYGAYAAILWASVVTVVGFYGKDLVRANNAK